MFEIIGIFRCDYGLKDFEVSRFRFCVVWMLLMVCWSY